jgi:hypothetical protein
VHLRRLRPGRATFFVALVALMLLATSVAAGAAGRAPRLSPEGLGPVHFGMDVDQAEAALGSPVDAEPGINDCTFWTLPGDAQGIAFGGRLGYISLFRRGTKTTRGIEVGDGLTRLRHRYRGRLHKGRSASLGAADLRLFASSRNGDATYELEFDIVHGKVAFISAGTRHTIETFGECA